MTEHSQHASLATEAALLLDVVADKLAPIVNAGREREANPPPPEDPSGQRTQSAPPCTSCPLCVVITVVKSDSGDINHKLAEGALMMVNALRGMLTDAAAKSDPATDTQPPPANPVQHIDIS